MLIPDEGLPVVHGKGARGCLIIEFELLFPAHLNDRQRSLLRAALLLPRDLDEAQTAAVKAFEAAANNPIKGWTTRSDAFAK